MASDDSTEKIFIFKYPTCTTNEEYTLEIPLKIPFEGSVKELAHRIVGSFELPCYVENDLLDSLRIAIKKYSLDFYDEKAERLIESAQGGTLDVEEIIKKWEEAYKRKTVEYAEPMGTSDEELFAAAYHRLVHSPSLEPILQAEHKYGKDVMEVIRSRDCEYEQITQKQTEEMRVAVETLEEGSTERSINEMAGRHFEEQSLLLGHWGSRVDTLKLDQRRQYRNWIMRLLEDQQTSTLPTPV